MKKFMNPGPAISTFSRIRSGIIDPLRKDLGDFTRILSCLRGKDHGRIGGIIPVPGILCQLHFDRGKLRNGKNPPSMFA